MKILVRRRGIVDFQGDVIDADDLLATDFVNLEDRLIVARQLHFGRRPVMRCAGNQFKSDGLQESHMGFDIAHDYYNMVNSAYHLRHSFSIRH